MYRAGKILNTSARTASCRRNLFA